MLLGSLVPPSSRRRVVRSLLSVSILGLGACADSGDSVVGTAPVPAGAGGNLMVQYECTVDVAAGTQSCQTPRPSGAARADLILGKPYVAFTTTGAASSRLDPANEDTTSMNVALTNQIGQPVGTLDGTTAAATGNRIFFHSGPTVTSVKVGTKTTETVRVDNPSGVGNFTSPDGTFARTGVPYYQYDGVLARNGTSAPKPWRFVYSANTKTFTYSVLVSVPVQYEFGWVQIAAGAVTGANHDMTATVYNHLGAVVAEEVTWSSSNSAVVTIDATTGVMTDVGPGYAAVTATSKVDSRRKGTMPVTVEPTGLPEGVLAVYDCQASTGGSGSLVCGQLGGYGDPNLWLTESNVSVAGNVLQFDLTVQNLLPEGVGTPDGSRVDTAGVTVFVASGTAGFAGVENADGARVLPGGSEARPFFRYDQKLVQHEVSGFKTYQLSFAPGTTEFSFQLHVVAEVQPLLVINEVMTNPTGPTSSDVPLEWFEVYNAGRLPVQMQNLLLADSGGSGRRAFHLITSPFLVPAGGYAVLGMSTNTADNGGVPVDYAYGTALSFLSLDALKISRAYGASDTLTLDRTQYASATISGKNGISRELINPALDNANMDGSNWADALATAVYGSGGRGTPKAQNSTYTP
ncbi:MAG: hypothetical protein AVDCRST_MAG68-1805 [uncultured Gemmatimonadetes bacterium]|uniref:BIG2 domain-containing protein n=1 Tax=uncultured Gemmatimonadota bacterium TaxID=203437 RepID=A0A6J4K4B2_9BACT|nr:MAG: hypothetical protein AVDCRST_MAG68-1805 [uncultured Gemmatimonadota bacterium]